VTGKSEPLPTTIDEGEGYRGDEAKERVEGADVMWEEAPESKYHLFWCGGLSDTVLKVDARDCWSQEGRPVAGLR
jgi:hypothetical protein